MFTLTAIRQLLKRGFDVELLCYPDTKIFLNAKKLGIVLHTISAKGYFHPIKILKLSQIFKMKNFDAVHSQSSKDLWLLVPALKLAKLTTPLFLTKQLGSYIVKKDRLHTALYNRVTTVFAISNVIKQNILDTTPIPAERVALLHNGIDLTVFDRSKATPDEFRKLYVNNDGEILIGMIARFSPGKGHEEFITAARSLSKKHSNLSFVVIGEASRGEDAYELNIKNSAMDIPKFHFSGYRSDIPNVLSALDIFVFPSHNEAFGIALAEALAMGVPSVCSRADGVLDIAVDGETSLLFTPKESSDLEQKLHTLIEEPELRKQLSENSIKRAHELFDIEKLTEKVIGFYKESVKK